LDYYPTRPETSLSMPIRMEKKRKRTKTGILALSIGLVLLGAAGYCLKGTGSEVIAAYAGVFGIALSGVGISLLVKANKGDA